MSRAWVGGSSDRWRRFRAWLFDQWAMAGRTRCEVQLSCCTGRVEQVDHIVSLARGGDKYDAANCRPSCAPCNRSRGRGRDAVKPDPSPRRISSW